MSSYPPVFGEKHNETKVLVPTLESNEQPHNNNFDLSIGNTQDGEGRFLSDTVNGMLFPMHDVEGSKYNFELSGIGVFFPNKCTMCGYGSDDWLFLCTVEKTPYILSFEIDSCTGLGFWGCVQISQIAYHQIKENQGNSRIHKLNEYYTYAKEIGHLHPDNIESARTIIEKTTCIIGTITDNMVYGI